MFMINLQKSVRVLLLLITAQVMLSCATAGAGKQESSLVKLVNPFIGTDFTGNTYPGAQVPFGMVQLSPDNGLPGWDRISGYFYPDSTIAGFSHTHLSGTGAGDLYDISFMPAVEPLVKAEAPLGIHSKFSHDEEHAHAGYYSVKLADYDIDVELTATERCGIQRYSYPGDKGIVFLNLGKSMNWDATVDTNITVIDSVTVEGYRYSRGWAPDQRLYFRTKFSQPFASVVIDTAAIKVRGGKEVGTAYNARFDFDLSSDKDVVVYTAISATGLEGAAKNLAAEIKSSDFNSYVASAEAMWTDKLSQFEIEDANYDHKVIFYTALYHSMLAPTIYNDVDGAYRGPDKNIHQGDFTNYGTFSLWDTYRAAHPLFSYTATEESADMVESLLVFYDQFGRLPVWNFQGCETDMMIGHHSIPVIVDAYLKGIGSFDPEHALEACLVTANNDDYRSVGTYKEFGYIPYNLEHESLSKTLEYAYNDYCIARMAEKMGKEDMAKEYYRRSEFYRNLYNPATGWIQPRDDRGKFIEDFDPEAYTKHITESNAWQYFWYAPQNVEGLIEITGGAEPFGAKLDSMFTYNPTADNELPIFSTGMIGQYAHGNEPSHHVIYLYNYIGQRAKTQKYVREVMTELYRNAPHGLCGNEDCGQMSAWYIFSSMGFYPVDPVGGEYQLGAPLFDNIKMKVGDKYFTVTAHDLSDENIYVQSVKINGEPYDLPYITHDHIMAGSTLEFFMGNTPKN